MLATAQPPAKAAPNTWAPIRIAALITVTTLGQTIRRPPAGVGRLMEWSLLAGAICRKGRVGSRVASRVPIRSRRPGDRSGGLRRLSAFARSGRGLSVGREDAARRPGLLRPGSAAAARRLVIGDALRQGRRHA